MTMKISLQSQRNLFIIVISMVALMGYIFAASEAFRAGFPLDDAWIHQTFSRNLVEHREWSFNPGFPTSGSTSPLWTLLLTPSFLFNISPLLWSYILGGIFFYLTVLLVKAVVEHFSQIEGTLIFILVIFAIALEWHLIWAAASGMETILFSLILVLIFFLTVRSLKQPLLIGLVTGLTIWLRPEGITMVGPIILIIIYTFRHDRKELIQKVGLIIGGLSILLIPYLLFNYALSGSLWPNTLLAKQIEYQGMLKTNGILRFFNLFATPMVGSNLLIIPGFIYSIYLAFRKKGIHVIAFSVWLLGFVLIYSLNLPVTYQHGRYLIPIIPIYLCVSIPGLIQLLSKLHQNRIGYVIQMAWSISIILVSLGFCYLGAKAYANDVAVIETEMVEPSKWIAQDTPTTSRIAAHDIGALGYFGQRYVIDLAGLVNKDVVPIVTDPISLQNYLKESNADYLMTFPNWYKTPLVPESRSVYIGKFDFAIQMGWQRMEVYILK